ncbi:MAG: CHAT domain-containing protein [Bacteroidales bacterium]|nr:CHAT domain-containing protein [Bacteroidales bacterium]
MKSISAGLLFLLIISALFNSCCIKFDKTLKKDIAAQNKFEKYVQSKTIIDCRKPNQSGSEVPGFIFIPDTLDNSNPDSSDKIIPKKGNNHNDTTANSQSNLNKQNLTTKDTNVINDTDRFIKQQQEKTEDNKSKEELILICEESLQDTLLIINNNAIICPKEYTDLLMSLEDSLINGCKNNTVYVFVIEHDPCIKYTLNNPDKKPLKKDGKDIYFSCDSSKFLINPVVTCWAGQQIKTINLRGYNNNRKEIHLPGCFELGSSELNDSINEKLKIELNSVKKNKIKYIEVIGYHCSIGSDSVNKYVANKRANNVKKLINELLNTDTSLIRTKTSNEYLTGNDTDKERQKNRSVIIYIFYNDIYTSPIPEKDKIRNDSLIKRISDLNDSMYCYLTTFDSEKDTNLLVMVDDTGRKASELNNYYGNCLNFDTIIFHEELFITLYCLAQSKSKKYYYDKDRIYVRETETYPIVIIPIVSLFNKKKVNERRKNRGERKREKWQKKRKKNPDKIEKKYWDKKKKLTKRINILKKKQKKLNKKLNLTDNKIRKKILNIRINNKETKKNRKETKIVKIHIKSGQSYKYALQAADKYKEILTLKDSIIASINDNEEEQLKKISEISPVFSHAIDMAYINYLNSIYKKGIDEVQRRYSANILLQFIESSKASILKNELKHKTDSLEGIISKLEKNGNIDGIIEYFINDSVIYSFVIYSGNYNVDIIQNELPEFTVSDYESLDSKDYKKRYYELYDSLINEPLKNFKKNAKILIIPNGELSKLSFESLIKDTIGVKKDSFNFLLNDYIFEYGLSAYLNSNDSVPSTISIPINYLGIAPFKKLKNSIKEVQYAEIIFDKGNFDILSDTNATAKNIIDSINNKDYDIIHFATHGKHDTLKLYNDSYLSSNEIKKKFNNLSNVKLVILSFCNSPDNFIENMTPTARAFMLAGAQNVLFTNTNINDAQSFEIIKVFLDNIKEKDCSFSKALIRAKRINISLYNWPNFFLYRSL